MNDGHLEASIWQKKQEVLIWIKKMADKTFEVLWTSSQRAEDVKKAVCQITVQFATLLLPSCRQ